MSSSGQKPGSRATERSNFVNLLSQYLKQTRSIADLGAGIARKIEANKGPEASTPPTMTKNLWPSMENPTDYSRQSTPASTSSFKTSDFFQNLASFGAPGAMEDAANKTDFRKPATPEQKTAQLTIFYAGEVLVFNDFPSEKAKEIMGLAIQGCSSSFSGVVSDSSDDKVKSNMDKLKPSNSDIPDLNIASTSGSSLSQECPVQLAQAIDCGSSGSDLPQVRRNSLHKFFERRKDRVAAKAPYQVNHPRRSPPPKPDEGHFLIEEGQSSKEASKDLDLKL